MSVIRRSDIDMAQLPGRRSGDPLRAVESASSARIVELEPGQRRTAHRHPHSEEVIVVAKGRARVWIEGVLTPVAAGDVIVIPTGAAHATVADEPVTLHCFFPHPNLADNYLDTDIEVQG